MIILSIGTNIGDRERNIENAVKALGEIGKVGAISPIYTSEPWGFESENGFYNIALTMESDLSPLDLLRETQRIEKELGRTTKTTTEYADRVIDIDIIDYDGQIIKISQQSTVNSQQQNVVTQRVVSDDPMEQNNSQFSILNFQLSILTLPHPLMHLRNFVLYPLADIAPEWRHPILKLTAQELKERSEDKSIPHKK